MSATRLFLIALGIAAGSVVVTWLVFAFWRVRSEMQRRAAGDAPLTARRTVIWRDPGPAENSISLPALADATAPEAPFTFSKSTAPAAFPASPCATLRPRVACEVG